MNDYLLAVLYVLLFWVGMAMVGAGAYLLLLPGGGMPSLLSILSRVLSSICIVLWGIVIARLAFVKLGELADLADEL